MERTRTTSAIARRVALPLISIAVIAGCTSQLTDPESASFEASTWPPTSMPADTGALERLSDPLPQDEGTAVDEHDPAAVAAAFVRIVTTRRRDESLDEWRARVAWLATPGVVAALDDRAQADVLGVGVAARNGEPVSTIAGIATGPCDRLHCQVFVVANQSVLLDGYRLDEQNLVTWLLDLVADEAHRWLVVSVHFGAGS